MSSLPFSQLLKTNIYNPHTPALQPFCTSTGLNVISIPDQRGYHIPCLISSRESPLDENGSVSSRWPKKIASTNLLNMVYQMHNFRKARFKKNKQILTHNKCHLKYNTSLWWWCWWSPKRRGWRCVEEPVKRGVCFGGCPSGYSRTFNLLSRYRTSAV